MTPAAATAACRPPKRSDRRVHRGLHVVLAAHVAHHRVHGVAVPGLHRVQVGGRGQVVLEHRVVGAAVEGDDLPTGPDERVDRRRADAAGRPGDDGGRAHETASAP